MKKYKISRFIGILLSAYLAVGSAGISAFAETLEDTETITSEDGSIIYDDNTSDSEDDIDISEDDPGSDDGTDENTDSGENGTAESDDSAIAGKFNEDNHKVVLPARNIRLKVSQTNKVIIGDTFQIKFAFTPLKSDDYVTYRNFNKNIVKVDDNGLVTAIGYGKAKIQLKTTSGVKKNVYIIVTDAEGNSDASMTEGTAESVDFVEKFVMLRVGKEFKIEPIFYPLGIYDELTYTSSNTSVISISQNGVIKGLKAGTATVTGVTANGVSAEFNVTVYDDILRGIDVSKWQGQINWKKVSVSGVDFVMIRSSFGSENTDEMLSKNVSGCEKYGIPYGFYHYTYARNVAEAKTEAKFFLKNIRKYSPEYPVVLDIEEEFYKKMSRKEVTAIITAFMDEVEKAGYFAMVYNSPNFIKACIDEKQLKKYDIWIACWGDEERLDSLYDGHYGIWQYSATGKVNGIDGDVDLDYAYKDYSKIIKKNNLNNL